MLTGEGQRNALVLAWRAISVVTASYTFEQFLFVEILHQGALEMAKSTTVEWKRKQ